MEKFEKPRPEPEQEKFQEGTREGITYIDPQKELERKLWHLRELKKRDAKEFEAEIDEIRGFINKTLMPEIWESVSDRYAGYSEKELLELIHRAEQE